LIVSKWNTATYNQMVVGTTIAVPDTQLSGRAGWYRGSVRRLNQELFLVESEGFSWDSTARQRVGVVVRLKPIEIVMTAALKTMGDVKVGGSSFLSGQDQIPTGWTGCPAPRPMLPALSLPPEDSASITFSGCGGMSCLEGDPKIKTDSTVNDSSLTHFGDASFEDLRSLATLVVPGGTQSTAPTVAGGLCQTSNIWNWGEPTTAVLTQACKNYFPVIWVEGNLKVNGSRGQGILIVDGDIEVQGGWEFYGPVIVRGFIKTTGTGGHFNGGVIAGNVQLEQNTILGNAVVHYSSCAMTRALNASAQGAQMRERGWFGAH
jgi:hypothetical protein